MKKTIESWVLLFLLALIWGSSFILMKKGMFSDYGEMIFTDSQVASMRMFIASVVLLPIAFRSMKKINKRRLLYLFLVALCGNFLPAFLFTYAETGISSGFTGMLNSLTPIFALLIGFFFFRDRLNRIQILGVFIGFVGVTLLVTSGKGFTISGDLKYVLAVVFATLCYAVSMNIIKNKLQCLSSFEIAALSFLLIFIPSGIMIIYTDLFQVFQSNIHAKEGVVFVLVLAVVGTAFALILFNKLVAISSVLFASSVTYLIPVVAALIGVHCNIN